VGAEEVKAVKSQDAREGLGEMWRYAVLKGCGVLIFTTASINTTFFNASPGSLRLSLSSSSPARARHQLRIFLRKGPRPRR
jgi:hypothetical protein